MTPTTNPLREYFRQPVIYIRLPSQGEHWPAHSLHMPANQELPVLPMTAVDEITYRTPDALYNGQSTVSVIASCVPDIQDAWHMPMMDFDSVLIAIRIASYGHELGLDTICPACGHQDEFTVDLRAIMDSLRAPDYGQPLIQGDLSIHFRPLTYRESTENSIQQFQEQKMLSLLADTDLDEATRIHKISEAMRTITDMTIRALARCVAMIKTPHGLVSDAQHIWEFLNNCDRGVFTAIRDHVVNLRNQTDIQPVKLTCAACGHAYDQAFTLDQSNFFGTAS